MLEPLKGLLFLHCIFVTEEGGGDLYNYFLVVNLFDLPNQDFRCVYNWFYKNGSFSVHSYNVN